MLRSAGCSGDTRLLLLTPADFTRPLHKTDPLNHDPASTRSCSSQQHDHDLLQPAQDLSRTELNQQAPMVDQPAGPCERCKNRSALEEEIIKRLLLNPQKIEANYNLLTGLEDLEKRRVAQESWKYTENCNNIPFEMDRRKSEPPVRQSPPDSPAFQNPPAFEEDFLHLQRGGSSHSDFHKPTLEHAQPVSQLAANSPKVDREALTLQETRPAYNLQERRTQQNKLADLKLDLLASDSDNDDDDDKYPFGRCYTGSPLLPRDSLDSEATDTSSSRSKSEETGEEEAGSLNYLGSIPSIEKSHSASAHREQQMQLPVGSNVRQISIQDTTNDEAIARALLEEGNPSLQPTVNNSTGQAASDDEVVRRKPSQPGEQADYQIARMMQEDYDEELAQAIHQHEQSHGAEPHQRPLSHNGGARPLSAGSPRRTDDDPAVETFLVRQRRREYYEKMQQQEQQARRPLQRQGSEDERRLLLQQRSLTYEELTDLEDVPCGVSTVLINRICGSFEYKKGLQLLTDPSSKESTQDECCICMCDFCDTNILRQLPCRHAFHRTCIDRWLREKKTCPVCLTSLI